MSNLFDLGGAVAAAAGNVISQGMANSANRELQARQNQFNIEQWNRQNEYNTPANQLKRLKQAGLNPDLMYQQPGSQVAGNSAAPAQGANPIPQQSVFNVDPTLVAQLGLMDAQKKNTNSDTESKNLQNDITRVVGLQQAMADLGYTEEQINYIGASTQKTFAEIDNLQEQTKLLTTQIDKNKAETEKVFAEIGNINAKTATEEQACNLLLAQIYGQQLSNEYQEIVNKYIPAQLQANIKKTYSEIQSNVAQAGMYNTQSALNKASAVLLNEQAKSEKVKRKGLEIDNENKKKQGKILDQEARIKKTEADFAAANQVVGMLTSVVDSGTRFVSALKPGITVTEMESEVINFNKKGERIGATETYNRHKTTKR